MKPELLSIKACVTAYGVSRSTLYRWLASSIIQGKKIGNRTYILTATVDRAIDGLPDFG